MTVIYSSSGDLLDVDGTDFSDPAAWTDNDDDTGASTDNESFDGQLTFKFYTGANINSNAARILPAGQFSLPATFAIEIKLYHDAIGTLASSDYLRFSVQGAGFRVDFVFATDNIYVNSGGPWETIGNYVQTGKWQIWVFYCDFTIPAAATVDTYLKDDIYDYVKVGDGTDCSWDNSGNDGQVNLNQNSGNTANRLTYIDYIKVGSDLDISSSDIRNAIIEGYIFSRIDSIIQGVSPDYVNAVMRSIIVSYRGSVILGALRSYNSLLSAILLGKSYTNRSALIEGIPTANNSTYAVLGGKYYTERELIVAGKPSQDINALMSGSIWSGINSIIRGSPWVVRYAIAEGKPYTDRSSTMEGHLIQTDLTFKYNINKASFDYYYVLANRTSTYESVIDATYYEEDSKPLYIYYGYGHEAYEYYPDSDNLIPAYSNVPADSEWQINVYANAVDNREERNAIIKNLSEVDFDAEIRKAFSKVVDQSYYTFRIDFGISGAGTEVYAIMRVRATSERRSWILGKDYPVYLIATDFGLYYLQTVNRWVKVASARSAVIRGD